MTQELIPQKIEVFHRGDVNAARRTTKSMAMAIGFTEKVSDELAIAASEIASNLIKHAWGGSLTLTPINQDGRAGIQIESLDRGPGIADVELAITDGFSTAGGMGNGLGAVNRIMDELDITSLQDHGCGTHIVCKRCIRAPGWSTRPCPFTFGAVTRPHPRMDINGDAFIIKKWGESALVGVIDGVGHGAFASRAAQGARHYIEEHFDQPLLSIFRGAERACRATRGVVMALARFDWSLSRLTFASVGNIEAHVFGSPEPIRFIVRRGVLGLNAPAPHVTDHPWDSNCIMVLHTDGLHSTWRWEDFPELAQASGPLTAQHLLRRLAKDNDDATVVVVRADT